MCGAQPVAFAPFSILAVGILSAARRHSSDDLDSYQMTPLAPTPRSQIVTIEARDSNRLQDAE